MLIYVSVVEMIAEDLNNELLMKERGSKGILISGKEYMSLRDCEWNAYTSVPTTSLVAL